MHAHRQDMVNVELTVAEVRYAIECAVLSKYPFLDADGWDLQDKHFHEKNLNSGHQDSEGWNGATYFFTKDIKIEDAPVEKKCGESICCDENNCLKPCR